MSLSSTRTGSRASPNRAGALYGAAASFHFALRSAFQGFSQKSLRAVMVDAKDLEENFVEVSDASAAYSVAAIILLMSWCSLVSSGGSLSCIWRSQMRAALLKKDVAVDDLIAQAPA